MSSVLRGSPLDVDGQGPNHLVHNYLLMAPTKSYERRSVKQTADEQWGDALPSSFRERPSLRLRVAQKAIRRAYLPDLAALGLSWEHYFVVRALIDEDGVTQARLSERVGIEPGTLTGTLDAMIARDLVERVQCVGDRRKWLIYLTVKGEALREPVLRTSRAALRRYLTGITREEYQTFLRVLDRIEQNANALAAEREGGLR